jgi:hypothetical protein
MGRTDDSEHGGAVRQVVDVRQSTVNDVALAKLDSAVAGIVPIELPTQPPAVGEHLEIAGWGSTSATNVVPSTHLNLGTFTVNAVADTTVQVQGLAPAADTSACPDDSGAPYFVPFGQQAGRLVSVENNGPDCPHASPETTARVDVISDWIKAQLAS